jgi:hypothetical protein
VKIEGRAWRPMSKTQPAVSGTSYVFYQPWFGMRRYRRVQQEMTEDISAENNLHLFDYHIPVANQPDF